MREVERMVVLVAALAACAHGESFAPERYTPGRPYDGAGPRRLTFDVGADLTPSWLPDESGVLYSFARGDRADGDRCLGLLPAEGGTRALAICNSSAAGDDSTDVFLSPVLSRGGRLAYFRSTARIAPPTLTAVAVVVGTLNAPMSGPRLENTPRNFAAGLAETVEQIPWLSDSDFVYLPVSQPALFQPACPLAIVRVRLRGDSAAYEVLANTDTASSVAVTGGDTIYFTVQGNTRVFRRALSSGATAVVHDFGGGRFPIAVGVVGARLVAIETGTGAVWLVDLTDGSEVLVPTRGPVLDQALAPSGSCERLEGSRMWPASAN